MDMRKALAGNRDLQMAFVLFILAFGLRYHFQAGGLFHTDSVIEANAAEKTIETGRLYYLQGELGYPGQAVLNTATYAVFRLFGASNAEASTLFSGVLFGALCVPMIFLLSRKIFDSEHVGVYSALMMTFLPVQLSLSTWGHGHGMELFFIMLTGYIGILAGERDSLGLKVLTAASMGFTMAIRQTSVLFLPALFLLYFRANNPFELKKKGKALRIKFNRPKEGLVGDVAIIVAVSFAVFVVFFVPKMINEPGFDLVSRFRSVSAETNVGFSLFSPMLMLSLMWATVSMTPLGWVLALVGAFLAWREDKIKALALILWFLLFFLYLGNLISTSPRFVIPALAAPVILAAVTVEKLWLKYDYLPVAIVMVVLVGWMFSNIYPVLEYRRVTCGPCDFSKRIGNVTEANAVIMGMDETMHYEYYAKRKGIGHPSGSSLSDPKQVRKSLDDIEAMIRNGTPVYVTTQGLSYDGMQEGMLAYDSDRQALINTQTGRDYSNVRFDTGKRLLFDRSTDGIYPLGGIYSLELFDRFSARLIFMTDNEDWHHSCIENSKYRSVLFKLALRNQTG
ncbi:MAG: glycosyltransferase family 39 protein [Candidatus Altiarchaeota archaeon]